MSKHTLRPWTYDGLGTVLGRGEKDNRPVVCRDVAGHADAKLIVAAPDLLESCEAMLRVLREDEGYRSFNPVCKAAALAIAKA